MCTFMDERALTYTWYFSYFYIIDVVKIDLNSFNKQYERKTTERWIEPLSAK